MLKYYELRVRKTICSNKKMFELTSKFGKGNKRYEQTTTLTEKEFNLIYYLNDDKPIHKIRYIIPYQDKKIELDIFDNYNTSFAEIEFDSEEEMENFDYPDWFGKEVEITNKDIFKFINREGG